MIALLGSGLSRERSYEIVQNCAMKSWDDGSDFRELLREEPDVRSHVSKADLESIFDYKDYMRYVDNSFDRLGL